MVGFGTSLDFFKYKWDGFRMKFLKFNKILYEFGFWNVNFNKVWSGT